MYLFVYEALSSLPAGHYLKKKKGFICRNDIVLRSEYCQFRTMLSNLYYEKPPDVT